MINRIGRIRIKAGLNFQIFQSLNFLELGTRKAGFALRTSEFSEEENKSGSSELN